MTVRRLRSIYAWRGGLGFWRERRKVLVGNELIAVGNLLLSLGFVGLKVLLQPVPRPGPSILEIAQYLGQLHLQSNRWIRQPHPYRRKSEYLGELVAQQDEFLVFPDLDQALFLLGQNRAGQRRFLDRDAPKEMRKSASRLPRRHDAR